MVKKRTSNQTKQPRWSSLTAFQSGPGVAFEKQIILIGNPEIFHGLAAVRYPYSKPHLATRIKFKLNKLFNGRNMEKRLYLPWRNNELFLGFFDKSIDNLDRELGLLFDLIGRYPTRDFSLTLGKGDYEIDQSTITDIPENLKVIFANNVNVMHPRIHYLPMGRDFRNDDLLENFAPSDKKDYLCYCNFSTNTHPVRKELFERISHQSFLKIEHMGNFLSYSISRREFLRNLRASKFCICPRGNAIDTFRLWDCMYLGTIPIVVREAIFHDYLADLPILFLDDYSQFSDLSADYLEKVYADFQRTKFNYSKLTIGHWLSV